MPVFRTTDQIFKGGIVFEENWLDAPEGQFDYPTPDGFWFSKKEIRVEDVDFWEVIKESGGGNGIYAAYQPYAEIYLVRHNETIVEVFSGKGANLRAEQFCARMGIEYPKTNDVIYAAL